MLLNQSPLAHWVVCRCPCPEGTGSTPVRRWDVCAEQYKLFKTCTSKVSEQVLHLWGWEWCVL